MYKSLLNPEFNTIPKFLFSLVDLIFALAVPLIVVFIIYGGFLFITAKGRAEQIEKARYTLGWTLLGAGVLLAAKIIAEALRSTVEGLK